MGNAKWSGVRLRDVLNRVGVSADALEVVLDGADRGLLPSTPDFVKSIPIERALDENTLIAFEMNGRPLPHWNGAPARLVVPGWTATYWVKHLTEVRIEPVAFDGFWMKSGYRIPTGAFPGARFASQETAETTPITEILVNSLVTSHASGDQVARGRPAQLAGWAWDGGSGISTVEVSHGCRPDLAACKARRGPGSLCVARFQSQPGHIEARTNSARSPGHEPRGRKPAGEIDARIPPAITTTSCSPWNWRSYEAQVASVDLVLGGLCSAASALAGEETVRLTDAPGA